MNDKSKRHSKLEETVDKFCNLVLDGFSDRWRQVTPRIYDQCTYPVIGGLLSRQATLAMELARSPAIWNGHTAPLILRCMTDCYITFAWILENPEIRANKYVDYGLGQLKLHIAHLKEDLATADGDADPLLLKMIDIREKWLNSQSADYFTDVNVGSWSEISTRDMAKEIDRESLYKFAYVPFSSAVHNMWHHVGAYNTKQCNNPLHKYHLVPCINDAHLDMDYLYRAAKYVSQTYELFDKKLEIESDVDLPITIFV